MSAAAAAAHENPITKSEFARRRGVSPGRVSQWIAEGKISRPALVGEGREQRVVESLAVGQLNQRLDLSQRFGNGLGTKLDAPAAGLAAPKPVAASGEVLPFESASPSLQTKADAIADQIAREKLEQMQRANRREAIEEAAEAGRLTDTAQAAQVAGRLGAQMVAVFEGALPELAGALAARFEVPYRDALHLLRGEFRKVRTNAAAVLRRQSEDLPATVTVEIEAGDDDPDHECRAPGDGGFGEGVGAAATG